MVKHIQTNPRLLLTNCLSVFDHFVDLALKGPKDKLYVSKNNQMIRHHNLNNTIQPQSITCNNKIIERVKSSKLFGITLDQSLSRNDYISNTLQQYNSTLTCPKKIKGFTL